MLRAAGSFPFLAKNVRLWRLTERGAWGPFIQKPFAVNPWKQHCRKPGLWCCHWRTGSTGNLWAGAAHSPSKAQHSSRAQPRSQGSNSNKNRARTPSATRAGAFEAARNVCMLSHCHGPTQRHPMGCAYPATGPAPTGAQPLRRGGGPEPAAGVEADKSRGSHGSC